MVKRQRQHPRSGGLPRNQSFQNSESGKGTSEQRGCPKARPSHAGATAGDHSHSLHRRPHGAHRSIPTRPCREKRWRVLTARARENKVARRGTLWGYSLPFRRGAPRPRQPREEHEDNTENQGMEPRGQRPPQRRYRPDLSSGGRRPETLNHEMAKTQGQLIHQLRFPRFRG